MPIYEGRIIIKRIDKKYKFSADNEEEASMILRGYIDNEVDNNTLMECYLEGKGEGDEEFKELLKKLDDFKITPEMIKRGEELHKKLSYISAEDLFRPFTI